MKYREAAKVMKRHIRVRYHKNILTCNEDISDVHRNYIYNWTHKHNVYITKRLKWNMFQLSNATLNPNSNVALGTTINTVNTIKYLEPYNQCFYCGYDIKLLFECPNCGSKSVN